MQSPELTRFYIDAFRRESLSTVQLKISDGNGHSATGTGFYVRFGEKYYLATAKHVLTGEAESRWKPRYLESRCFRVDEDSTFHVLPIDMRLVSEGGEPAWMEVDDWDLAAIEMTEILCADGYTPFAINISEVHLHFSADGNISHMASDTSLPRVADDVFVVGFPSFLNGIMDENTFPIWKRAAIASEPHMALKGRLPQYLIDIIGRKGLSGSPVFTDGRNLIDQFGRQKRREIKASDMHLVGIYVGREGLSPSDAFSLGRVYKRHAIQDLILGNGRKTK